MGRRRTCSYVLAVGVVFAAGQMLLVAAPMGTAFTYQGRLMDDGSPANGLYDFEFKLYDAVADGNQYSSTLYEGDVDVNDGDFMVDLDFGSDPNRFDGDARWLATGVRPGASTGSYTPLSPRQELTPTPYALYSAGTAGIDVNDGYVGIGTDNPQAKLHIDSSTSGASGEELLRLSRESVGPAMKLLNFDGTTETFNLLGKCFTDTWYDLMAFDVGSRRVGIGTMSPSHTLTINTGGTNKRLGIYTDGTYGYLLSDGGLFLSAGGPGQFYLRGSAYGIHISDDDIADIHMGNGDVFVDVSSGRVGIGTTSPSEVLEVASSSNTKVLIDASSGTGQAGLTLKAGNGETDRATRIDFFNEASGSGYPQWTLANDYNQNGTNEFNLINNTPSNRVLVVTQSGDVGIGTTSPTETLDVSGTARLRGISAGTGTTVVADANGKLWKDSSSRRYKTAIADLSIDPAAVLQLRPVSFQWQETGQPDVGLIAEEVEQLIGDLVIYDRDGRPDGVKYQKLAVYLLDVVRTQEERIRALEELNARDESLRRRLQTLEEMMAQSCVRQVRGE